MSKAIIIISGSPKKEGNTDALIGWFLEGAASKGARAEVVYGAFLKYKYPGCLSCRQCQKIDAYECSIEDEAKPVLKKMAEADVIVMATPLYFFSASAQIKIIFDRMFSLYKWNNQTGAMKTVLKGKTFVLMASAYEDTGLEVLEKPFKLTADYTGMKYESLLIGNAGVSGDIKKNANARQGAFSLGARVA